MVLMQVLVCWCVSLLLMVLDCGVKGVCVGVRVGVGGVALVLVLVLASVMALVVLVVRLLGLRVVLGGLPLMTLVVRLIWWWRCS